MMQLFLLLTLLLVLMTNAMEVKDYAWEETSWWRNKKDADDGINLKK
jgi:hypothetical protein